MGGNLNGGVFELFIDNASFWTYNEANPIVYTDSATKCSTFSWPTWSYDELWMNKSNNAFKRYSTLICGGSLKRYSEPHTGEYMEIEFRPRGITSSIDSTAWAFADFSLSWNYLPTNAPSVAPTREPSVHPTRHPCVKSICLCSVIDAKTI